MGLAADTTPPARLKAGSPMRGLDLEHLANVTRHPWQLDNVATVRQLLEGLDACDSPADMYGFQRDLFVAIYDVETRRAKCSRAAKRVRQGKAPQADAPNPRSGADPTDPHTWDLEVFVAERVARQLRSVGDGLAWKAFRYDRRFIYALSRNEPSGPIVGKAGLQSEIDTVDGLWNQEQHFALLHDLTTCLRIADVTEFADDQRRIHEVKKSGRPNPPQNARAQAAVDAVTAGGGLPGAAEDTRLAVLATRFRTDLRQVGDAIRLARERGVQGISLSEGRMVFASSILDVIRIHNQSIVAAPAARRAAWDAAIRRASIDGAAHLLIGVSSDRAGRSPTTAPLSIFPLSAADRAALICDHITFEVVQSSDALVSLLEARGITVEVRLPEARAEHADPDEEIIRLQRGPGTIGVSWAALDPLLFEAMRPSTWCDGVLEVFDFAKPPAHPALVWHDDARSWR